MSTKRPVSLVLAALGGQGGGVVSGWLTTVARLENYVVQATSVPGVAQRTGATLYYLEFYPEAHLPADGRRPVMALMPSPGDVDVVVATELAEAGRALRRGLITPDRTSLIASTHRAYTITEKSMPGDGRWDPSTVLDDVGRCAKRAVLFDMAAIAQRHGAVISSVILGAIAGAAGLPFADESYREAIRRGGIAVETNLTAFNASLERAREEKQDPKSAATARSATIPDHIRSEIRQRFPSAVWETIEHGVERLLDYQDLAYAKEYVELVSTISAIERPEATGASLTVSVARGLALWMTVEDTIRVAQLKTRPERFEKIQEHVRARPDHVIEVTEFLKPRFEEVCGTLPAGLGRRMRASTRWRRWLRPALSGRTIRTTSITGYVFMRGVAALRRWRRSTLRYVEERAEILAWLSTIREIYTVDPRIAIEVAESQHLVRGYGETYDRGLRRFHQLLDISRRLSGNAGGAQTIASLRMAALADADVDIAHLDTAIASVS